MRILRSLLVVFSVAILSACGGGGSPDLPTERGSDAVAKFEGLFEGRVDARRNWVRMLVLPDGEAWIFYGARAQSAPVNLGYAAGRIRQDGSVVTSVGITDYGAAAGAPMTLNADINSRGEVTGTLQVLSINSGRPADFSLRRVVEGYEFSATPTLPDAANTFFENEDGSVQTGDNDEFIFSLLGCVSPGTVMPHESGNNVYTVSVTLENRDCRTRGLQSAGTKLSGIVYFIDLGAGRKEMNLFLNEFAAGTDGIEEYLHFRAESKAG